MRNSKIGHVKATLEDAVPVFPFAGRLACTGTGLTVWRNTVHMSHNEVSLIIYPIRSVSLPTVLPQFLLCSLPLLFKPKSLPSTFLAGVSRRRLSSRQHCIACATHVSLHYVHVIT